MKSRSKTQKILRFSGRFKNITTAAVGGLMIQRPTATIIRRNFYHRNYKYHQINESKLSVHFLQFEETVKMILIRVPYMKR
ncbi:unnamed protein product [Onchocerca flexuosa]|uniref:Uncharacterized protein n=1 Tax=Onchocerca flexuosa TaxID=387005 RepID=A0A183GYQ2_9BILA|nr:unnamed protein product [Onchocerca flexuosa]